MERTLERGLGATLPGKVARVLPGMQSAFIDIGLGAPHSCTWPTSGTASRRASRPVSCATACRRCRSKNRSSKASP